MLGLSKSISGFDPRSIVGCALWLDGADSNSMTFSSGSNISTWVDKSPNGYIGTSSGSPTFVTNNQNGLPVVNFVASSSQYFNFGNIIPQTPQSIFFVGKSTYVNGTSQCFIAKSLYGGQTGRWALLWDPFVGNYLNYLLETSAPVSSDTTGTITPYSGLCSLFEGVWDGTTKTLYGNGTQLGTNSVSSAGTSTTDLVLVGAYNNSSGGVPPTAGYYYNGTMCEIIVFSNALTTTQRQSIEGYLAWKWGLQVQTPVAPVLTPLSVPGCQLWLDAADKTKIAPSAGGTLTSWTDKSGTGKTVTVASAPTYSLTAFNGLPCLTFASGNSLTIPITAPGTNDIAIFAVWKETTSGSANDVFSIGSPGGGTETAVGWNGGQVTYKIYRYGGSESVNNTVSYNTTVVSSGLQLSGLRYMYINGINPTGGTGGTDAYNQTNTTAYIGGGSFPLIGQVAEIIYYQATLTATQRQSIENYLMGKWGIKPSLPATHPFYSLPAFSRPFGPTDIPGCALWLDAADASTVVLGTGSNISQWRDKSGNGIYASPSNGASGVIPTYSNSAVYINNGGSATYNSSTYTCLAINSNFQLGTSFTLFAVFNFTTTTGYQSIYQNSRGTNAGGTILSVGNTQILEFGADQTTQRNISSGQGFTNFGTTRSVVSFHSTPASLYLYQNGSVLASNVTAATLPTTDVGPFPNIGGGYTDNRWGTGYFNEIICYTAELTTTQRQSVEGYLAAKWGLLNNLPGKTLSPLNIPGCALWLDASDATTISYSGSAVISIKEKAQGITLTAQGTSSFLTTPAASIGSLQSLLFNNPTNANVYLSGTFQSILTGCVFIVWKSLTQSAANFYPIFTWNSGSTYPAYGQLGGAALGTYGPYTAYGGSGTPTFVATANTNYLTFYSWSGTTPTVGINGAAPTSGTQPAFSGSTTTFWIGADSTGGAQRTNMNLGELIIFNSVISSNQRQSVENYLMSKWGISNVTTHPFKSIPPSTSQPPQFQEVTPGNWKYDWQPYLKSLAAANSSGVTVTTSTITGGATYITNGWAGGVLGPDGNIYFTPSNAANILKLNVTTGVTTNITGGATYTTGGWSGGVLAPNGNIYFCPYNATNILVLNPITGVTSNLTGGATYTSGGWAGGVVGPDGNIYCCPIGATNILKLNVSTGVTTNITGGATYTATGWVCGQVGPDGNIYFTPVFATNILKLDPSTGVTTNITGGATILSNGYRAGTLGLDGNIYSAPYSSANILKFSVSPPTVTTITGGATMSSAWQGGVLAADGNIYFLPNSASSLIRLNTTTGVTTNITGGATYTSQGWIGGVLAPDGNIYSGPYFSSSILKITFSGLSQLPSLRYCLSPWTNKF